ncbi:MAG: hypothetical protein KKA35_16645, partial [Proteobacteria bacterium]|nr:hypothetical protein [Pseudomonadota bacterium]
MKYKVLTTAYPFFWAFKPMDNWKAWKMELRYNPLIKIWILTSVLLFSGGLCHGDSSEKDGLFVYYFHRSFRCPSCILLEEVSRESVLSGFEPELKAGKIRFLSINLDEPGQAHFEHDFGLTVQSVVISTYEKRQLKQWKRLDQVWDLIEDEYRLMEYI